MYIYRNNTHTHTISGWMTIFYQAEIMPFEMIPQIPTMIPKLGHSEVTISPNSYVYIYIYIRIYLDISHYQANPYCVQMSL